MDENMMSSNTTNSEASDSNGGNSAPQKCKPTSKYKGVVPQANGNWGAQIYANHHRIWLGTFKTEDMAGAAYDSAAIKLRHGNSSDPHRNFPLNDSTIHESVFQEQYTVDQVLNMIKDGSYQTKFDEFLSITRANGSHSDPSSSSSTTQRSKDGCFYRELFRKELTPSDVGKLNRLVIPKRYAIKFFSPKELLGEDFRGDENGGDTEMTFFDKVMRAWKFRYCYWQSSSSFVFTRGWNSFVREKNLKAKDIVAFYMCELREKNDNNNNKNNNNDNVKKFYMIDVVGYNGSEVKEEITITKRNLEEVSNDELQAKKGKLGDEIVGNEVKSFRLFGVDVFPQS